MYMLRRIIYILIFAIATALTAAVVYAVSNSEETTTQITIAAPSPTITPILSSENEEYEVIINLSNEEITPETTTEITPTATIAVTPTLTATPATTPQQTKNATPEPTSTPKPTNTPIPTAEPTDTPMPTATPTEAPDYTLNQDAYFISEVLRGVNEARDIDGIPHVYLCDELTELAEQHAIAMALKDEYSFHSDYFYVESVRSGVYISGYMEGVGAAGHATQLGMDEDIIRIGVGSATSRTGRVFTCVLGGRDPSIYN